MDGGAGGASGRAGRDGGVGGAGGDVAGGDARCTVAGWVVAGIYVAAGGDAALGPGDPAGPRADGVAGGVCGGTRWGGLRVGPQAGDCGAAMAVAFCRE